MLHLDYFFPFEKQRKHLCGKLVINNIFYLILIICKYFSTLFIRESCGNRKMITLFMTLYFLHLPELLKGKPVKNHLYLIQSADSAEFC